MAKERSSCITNKGAAKPAPIPKRSTIDSEKRPVGCRRDNRYLRWIHNAELDFLGFGISGIGYLRRFAARHQFLVIFLQHAVVAVEILSLHQYTRRRLRDLFDLLLFGFGFGETSLQGGDNGLGIDQLDLDLVVDAVGDLTFVSDVGGLSRARRLSRLRLERGDRLPSGFHIRMVLGVFQQQAVEISANLLKPLLDRCQPAFTVDNHLRAAIDGQHRRHRSQFFLQGIPLCNRVREFEFRTDHRTARLIEPIAIIVACRRVRRPVLNYIRVLFGQLPATLLSGTQLISIRGDLAFQESLRTVHFGSAAAGHLLGEDR